MWQLVQVFFALAAPQVAQDMLRGGRGNRGHAAGPHTRVPPRRLAPRGAGGNASGPRSLAGLQNGALRRVNLLLLIFQEVSGGTPCFLKNPAFFCVFTF